MSWIDRFMKRRVREKGAAAESLYTDEMRTKIALWDRLYKNNPDYLGGDIKSLCLPAAIAGEMARLVTIEMKARLDDSENSEPVRRAVDYVMRNIRRCAEYACAKGGIVFKPYVSGEEIDVDFIQADMFFPTEFNSKGDITGAVFKEALKRSSNVYTRVETHSLKNGRYTVTNQVYKSKNAFDTGIPITDFSEVDEWRNLCGELVIDNVKRPLFAYFKMPSANTVNPYSPLGMSVFANAEDLIEQADRQYSRLLWEFESGERALYLDSSAYRRDEKGKIILPDKRLYRSADTGADGLFEDWSPEFREKSILNGLNAILERIEDVCGISRGTFSNANLAAKTATELNILKQRSYAAVTDIQRSLRYSLEHLIYAMTVWGSVYGLMRFEVPEASFEFDDSIVSDRNREFDERERLVNIGAMTAEELRAWYLGAEDTRRL